MYSYKLPKEHSIATTWAWRLYATYKNLYNVEYRFSFSCALKEMLPKKVANIYTDKLIQKCSRDWKVLQQRKLFSFQNDGTYSPFTDTWHKEILLKTRVPANYLGCSWLGENFFLSRVVVVVGRIIEIFCISSIYTISLKAHKASFG